MNLTDTQRLEVATKINAILIRKLGGSVIITQEETADAYLNMTAAYNWQLIAFTDHEGYHISVVDKTKNESHHSRQSNNVVLAFPANRAGSKKE